VYWQTFLPRLKQKIVPQKKVPVWGRVRRVLDRFFAPPVPWFRVAGAVATALLVFFLGRALVHHEARMGRVRSLPKKLLTEQAHLAKKETAQERREKGTVRESQTPGTSQIVAPLDEKKLAISPETLADKQVEPLESSDQDISKTSRAMLPEKEPVATPPPPPSIKPVITADQALSMEGEMLAEKTQESFVAHRADKEAKAGISMVTAARTREPERWREQINIWQDSIKAHPRSDRLAEVHLHLAESWYHLAQMTGRREDLLPAVKAQRAALDFATGEPIRELLRERIHTLEEQLQKK
ncbi:hypothetical protein KAX22_08855, partial [bacterium]|nr:hypothetical protein [bacterium]